MSLSEGWFHCRVGDFDLRAEWRVEAGQVLVLFGPSGGGKTTTLRAIAGLLRPLSGVVRIAGRTVYDAAAGVWAPAHKRRVGYLTQQYHLFPHLTVAKNVAYGLPSGRDAGAQERVRSLLQTLELEGFEERYPWELSGGQQQRAALARVLATGPEILLLDEPFAALDAELRRTVRRELRALLARNPAPVILVTHDREEALALGDAVQVIDGGRTVAQGQPLDVLGQPGQARVARLVGVENLFRMRVESRQPRDGTMSCRGAGLRLEVPLDHPVPTDSGANDAVTVGIRASDIILAKSEPVGSSARNRIPGRVVGIEPRPPGYTVELDCGGPLRCQVTGAALEEMGVQEGQRLWAVFKASSCFLVDET